MGSRMEKKVTIVIPNYNGKRFLDDCLSSLERQTSKDFETLVIDNASQDDSVSYIREHYPWVKIAVMRHNLGFSGGVNVGIGMCTTPYVLLLNNDTRSFPKMVEELIKTMESADDIFSVSCKMIQFHDHEKMIFTLVLAGHFSEVWVSQLVTIVSRLKFFQLVQVLLCTEENCLQR